MNSLLQQRSAARYVDDAVATASPAKLLTLLYDTLARDLQQAEEAIVAGDIETVNHRLGRAQDIVAELRSSLDTTAWEGGPALASLYAHLLTELISANVNKDAAKVADCRRIVEPLRAAWHEAAAAVTADGPAPSGMTFDA